MCSQVKEQVKRFMHSYRERVISIALPFRFLRPNVCPLK